MKSFVFLVATGALLASASPIEKRAPVVTVEKRAPVKTITEWVYATEVSTAVVTLAPGEEPPAQAANFKEAKKPSHVNEFEDSPESAPTNVFEDPPIDIDVDVKPPPQKPRPVDVPSEYKPNNRPRPTPAPSPLRPKVKDPAPSYAPAGGNLDDYAKSMLDKHNEARKEHRVPAFKWNDELAQQAKASAMNCIQTHDKYVSGGCQWHVRTAADWPIATERGLARTWLGSGPLTRVTAPPRSLLAVSRAGMTRRTLPTFTELRTPPRVTLTASVITPRWSGRRRTRLAARLIAAPPPRLTGSLFATTRSQVRRNMILQTRLPRPLTCFKATFRVSLAKWFLSPRDSPHSCRDVMIADHLRAQRRRSRLC